MTHYQFSNAMVIIYLLVGILSITFVDAHPALLIFTFICFLGAMLWQDTAKNELIRITDQASMDRPE